jgi:two-component system sensor histidine kinase YesM
VCSSDLENKNNQLKALQAQLDPHFINNTLQTIGAEALKKGNLELYGAILHFGEMMRYTMNFREMKVWFGDEVGYTENYLNFMKMRFKDRLDYVVDVSPEVLEIEVPKLLLQPLVENSIKHGYSDAEIGVVRISIRASVRDGRFSMTCGNSGTGLGPGELVTLRRNLEQARDGGEESTNIGLRNLARRLQILYGDRALLAVDSKAGKGFSVTLEIPLEDEHAQCPDSR